MRGRSINLMVAAAVYAACRSSEVPRTLEEISEATKARKKDIARNYRVMHRELEMKMPVQYPKMYISQIASKAGISSWTERRAIEILELARNKGILSGKDPRGLAAAALYKASLDNERMTQKELAEAASVTEVTIRNRYKQLEEELNL